MDSFMQRRNVLGLGAALRARRGRSARPSEGGGAGGVREPAAHGAGSRQSDRWHRQHQCPPWHFENDKGELVGMDIAMGRILAKGLFDDDTKVQFQRQDPAARIPNITTGKVDITIQFMTISAQRAQLIAFSRPYYVEGIAPARSAQDGCRYPPPMLLCRKKGSAAPASPSCRTWMPTTRCTRCCRMRR